MLILAGVFGFLLAGILLILYFQKEIRPGSLAFENATSAASGAPQAPEVLVPATAVPTKALFVPYVEKSAPATLTPSFTPLPTTVPSATPTPTLVATSGVTPPPPSGIILDSFEGLETAWKITREVAGSGAVIRSNLFAQDGVYSAKLSTGDAGSKAQLRVAYTESATAHTWGERPGTWFWQRASVYIPAATVQSLGAADYVTLAGLYPSAGGTYGWWLRLRQGGALSVYGYDANGAAGEFPVYANFPADQWVELSLGLHSQNGPGVKRAFAFLINGNFYGWYHQGHMQNEVYDRAAFGILNTNSAKPLQLFVDSWRPTANTQVPEGPDNRSTANLQEQDFRVLSGIQWQIDWSTWKNDLRLHATHGLYSATDRLQSGRNLDRMPDLTSGWAEIEIGWPNGTPPAAPTGYFGSMVGFRKEINREENFEVIPIGRTGGKVDLVLEAWVNGGPIEMAQWPMPDDNANNIHIPGAGDIIRVKWQQINANQMTVQASYFDASKNAWNLNVINTTVNTTNVGGINFNDGNHKASSITIDSTHYSIRRYKVGTFETAP